ncbi:MAG: hypothetical protein HYY88_03665 [candidate division NC10 bacterium]|nr:hypothetical protein [candidate division NC10 bacterium]
MTTGIFTVWEVNHLRFFDPGNLERAREILRVRALPPRWRSVFEERLIKAGIPVEVSERQAAEGEGSSGKGAPPSP